MTIFSDLVDEVYTLTNRPDLIALTKSAVKSATLKAHQTDTYPKDLFETGIRWEAPAFIQSIDYKTIVPRWRSLKYLRKWMPPAGTLAGYPGDFFKAITPGESLDAYGYLRDNVCYMAGSMVEVRSSSEDSYMILGCYIWPDIGEETYSSWIATDFKYSILHQAAATVLRGSGNPEDAAGFDRQVADDYFLLKQELSGGGD